MPVMQAHDYLGNRRLSGGDTFLVWLEGPVTVHGSVEDKGTGVYTATYNITVSGMYSMYITNGAPLPPSLPASCRPASCWATGSLGSEYSSGSLVSIM